MVDRLAGPGLALVVDRSSWCASFVADGASVHLDVRHASGRSSKGPPGRRVAVGDRSAGELSEVAAIRYGRVMVTVTGWEVAAPSLAT